MQTINIETNQQDDYQVRESYRNLRTNIFLSGKDTKVVMFTSCGPNEGKSTVTMNLASSIADGGKRVLFIDCDLRKSVLVGRYRVKKGVMIDTFSFRTEHIRRSNISDKCAGYGRYSCWPCAT